MKRWIALAVAVCAGTPAYAQVETISEGPDRAAVVIYREEGRGYARAMIEEAEYGDPSLDGLALIVETRTVDLPAGEAVIRFRGLATGIIPQTATLDGLPAGVVERNTDFDLLSPASLLQRSIGETVRVARTNPVTGAETILPAIVRAGAGGAVLEVDGRVEALDCQGLTQRIIFDRVPEGLGAQPVLSVRTRAAAPGRHTVTLAYLAGGLQWSADYVARLNPDGETLDLTGWITLANYGGTAFPKAPVQVVAGRLDRDYDTSPLAPAIARRRLNCWPTDTTSRGVAGVQPRLAGNATVVDYLATIPAMSNSDLASEIDEVVVTGSRVAELGELGDYKIYTLPEPTDVNAQQTKQVRFLERSGVRFARVYRHTVYDGREDDNENDRPVRPGFILKLDNREAAGLGVPLPGGGVSLVESRGGRDLFAGQTTFFDRGVGLPVEWALGEAADISIVTDTLENESWQVRDRWWQRLGLAVTIANDQDQPVEVEIMPWQQRGAGFRILRSSQRSVVLETGATAWRVRVPARGTATLTYSIQFED